MNFPGIPKSWNGKLVHTTYAYARSQDIEVQFVHRGSLSRFEQVFRTSTQYKFLRVNLTR
jgi:hypothetical protein